MNSWSVVSVILIPLFVGVWTFFAYKILGMAKQVNDVHEWKLPNLCRKVEEHIRTERASIEKVQTKVEHIHERQSELVAHKAQLEQLHSKLATVAMNVQALDSYIRTKCGNHQE